MIHQQILSRREKILSIAAAAFLIVMLIVGYAKSGQANSLAALEDDVANQQDHLENQRQYLKNLEREIETVAKTPEVVTDEAVSRLREFGSCLDSMEPLVGKDSFWHEQERCTNFSKAIEETLSDELRPRLECVAALLTLEDKKEEKRRKLDRDLATLRRLNQATEAPADFSELDRVVADINVQLARAEDLTVDDCSGETILKLSEVNTKLDLLFEEWLSRSQELGDLLALNHRLKDGVREYEETYTKQCKSSMTREFKRFESDLLRAQQNGVSVDGELAETIDRIRLSYATVCEELIRELRQALDDDDLDHFDLLRDRFNDEQAAFWSPIGDVREKLFEERLRVRSLNGVMRDLDNHDRELTQLNQKIERLRGQDAQLERDFGSQGLHRSSLDLVKSLLAQADSVLSTLKQRLASLRETVVADPDAYWDKDADELMQMEDSVYILKDRITGLIDVFSALHRAADQITLAQRDLEVFEKRGGLPATTLSRLKSVIEKSTAVVDKTWERALDDIDSARDSVSSLDELRFQWEQLVDELHQPVSI
ncbi:hypothetical protein CO046_03925 [Candidatus Peregrinibacteria bacterium CG_4_9_14_0_2_um_filter_53_11]|nr:MAG: hypothetical protein CO046_03925 [Candidatus Peregrinibacteria bacterium CG_4_9_14_0_2_um_filter_53_11]